MWQITDCFWIMTKSALETCILFQHFMKDALYLVYTSFFQPQIILVFPSHFSLWFLFHWDFATFSLFFWGRGGWKMKLMKLMKLVKWKMRIASKEWSTYIIRRIFCSSETTISGLFFRPDELVIFLAQLGPTENKIWFHASCWKTNRVGRLRISFLRSHSIFPLVRGTNMRKIHICVWIDWINRLSSYSV